MATSFKLSTGSYDGRYLYLSCTQTKDIANNKSIIDWTLTSTGGSVNYYDTGPTDVYIGGKHVYHRDRVTWDSYAFPAAKGKVSGTVEIDHEDDGTAKILCTVSTAIYTGTVTESNKYWTLDDIPRAATLTSAPNFTDEENPTIVYSNPAGDAVDSILACISDNEESTIYAAYREIPSTGSSYTFELTDEERQALINAIPDGKDSVYVRFYVKTIINGETVEPLKYLTRILSITNATPELTVSVKDIGSGSTALTGDENTIIKGFNYIYATLTPTLKKGASVKKQSITNGNMVSIGEVSDEGMTAVFNNAEDDSFIFSVTDSFGQTVNKTETLNVVPYIKLTCNITVNKPTADGDMAFKINGNYFNNDFRNNNVFDGQLEEGMYTATGEKVEAGDPLYRSVNPSEIEPDTTYVMSVNGIAQRFAVFFYDENNTFISYDFSNTDGTFVSPENAKYVNFRCLVENYISDYENLNVRIEKGTLPSAINTLTVAWRVKENNSEYGEWTPVESPTITDNTYESIINLTGLNYRSTYTLQARAGDKINTSVLSVERKVKSIPVFNWGENNFDFNVPVTVEGDGTILDTKNKFDGILEVGSYDSKTGDKTVLEGQFRNAYPVEIEPNTTYTISVNGVAHKFVVLFYDQNKTFLSEIRDDTTGTITSPENAKYLNFRSFASDYTDEYVDYKVQIEASSTVTEYVKHRKYGYEKNNIVNLIYPIGSIYISVNSVSPSILFGGTWEQLKDRFLLGSGDTYTAGTTGGEATHTLTIEEMPSHTHSGVRRSSVGVTGTKSTGSSASTNSTTYDTDATGGGQAHNNMPPYLAVYMWKRIA